MSVIRTSAMSTSPYPRSIEQQPLLNPTESNTEGIVQNVLRTAPFCGVVGAMGGGFLGFILARDNHGAAVLVGAIAAGSGGAAGGAVGRVAAIFFAKLGDNRPARAFISAWAGSIIGVSIGLGLNLVIEENLGLGFYIAATMLGYAFLGVMSLGMDWLIGNTLPAGWVGTCAGVLIGMGTGAGLGSQFQINDAITGNTTGVGLGAAIGCVIGGFAGLMGGIIAPEVRNDRN
jgi:hypothetical protein